MKKIFVALMCAVAIVATSTTAFAQKKAGQTVVKVSFRNADDTKSTWPFAEKKFTKEPAVNEATVTLKKTGYAFDLVSSSAMYMNSKFGFMFGGAAGNYMKLPAVKGKTLTKVSVTYGGKGGLGKLVVADVKGKALEGCKPASSRDMNYVHTWEVSGLKKGKPALLMLTADSVVKMKALELIYE